MEIFHKVFSNGNAQFKKELDLLGFSYKYEENIVGKIITFEIPESHPQWHIIKEITSRHGVYISQRIAFSKKEIAEAEWLEMACTGHFGYPQPEDDYIPCTYDIKNYCERCGIGGNQKASFHFSSEPKMKRSHFFQLNWVFDEFFVKPEVKLIFQQNAVSGVSYFPCIHHRSGKEIESIQQMQIKTILPNGLITTHLNKVTCKKDNEESHIKMEVGALRYSPDYPFCGRAKYHHPTNLPLSFQSGIFSKAPDVVKSAEWFGSGGQAFRAVIVSRKVANIILEKKWRGISLYPIQLSDMSQRIL